MRTFLPRFRPTFVSWAMSASRPNIIQQRAVLIAMLKNGFSSKE